MEGFLFGCFYMFLQIFVVCFSAMKSYNVLSLFVCLVCMFLDVSRNYENAFGVLKLRMFLFLEAKTSKRFHLSIRP